jgi:chitin disaccharide deacetylase
MFPVALKGIVRAARKCGVRAIRNPFEPIVFATSGNWKRRFQLGILKRYQATFREELAAAHMVTPNGCIGIVATGGLNLATFQDLIRNLPEGTWEFVSHPGYNDGHLQKVKTRLRDSRETELAILTSEAVKVLLRNEEVELISYYDLAPA